MLVNNYDNTLHIDLPYTPFDQFLPFWHVGINPQTHPCLLNSDPMWSANRTVLSWPRVSVSGVGVLGLGCSAGQLSTTQPCLWPEGFKYSVAPPSRTALKAAARSTLTLNPSPMTSPPETGRTPLPWRDRTLDITAGGTWVERGNKSNRLTLKIRYQLIIRQLPWIKASLVFWNWHFKLFSNNITFNIETE